MKFRRLIGCFLLSTVLLATCPWQARAQERFDWSGWSKILQKHVHDTEIDGTSLKGFDYESLRKQRAGFDELVKRLSGFDPSGLSGRTKLAFWINAYNVAIVKLVLDHPGISSVNDIGGKKGAVWKMPALDVGGRSYGADDIEHGILRKLGEPRIHFAIVCASVSCPDIRPEAYTAEKLYGQLDDQARTMLGNPKKGLRVDGEARRIFLSKIFEWFEKDFGGKDGVYRFIRKYAGRRLPGDFAGYALGYLPYDWKLNAWVGKQRR